MFYMLVHAETANVYCLRFKAFAAQPRLAIVTKTLALAANDLTHFGIALCQILSSVGFPVLGRSPAHKTVASVRSQNIFRVSVVSMILSPLRQLGALSRFEV